MNLSCLPIGYAESPAAEELDLILRAREGDSDAFAALFREYRYSVFRISRSLFAPGADRDDLIQEGTIGFFKAIRDYREDRGSFAAFVDLCVRRQVITFVKTRTRKKHEVLNYACSLDAPAYTDSEETLLSRLAAPQISNDPPDGIELLRALWEKCSSLERNVLVLYSRGYKFEEIATEIGIAIKSVDNALWRVKVKARKLADASDEALGA